MRFVSNFLYKFLSAIIIFIIIISAFNSTNVQAQSNDIERKVNTESGRVSFIGPAKGNVLPAIRALGTSIRPDDPALALAIHFAPEFGIQNPSRDLSVIKSSISDAGRITTRFQQTYQDIPVMAGELIVNTNENGDLYSINGEVSPKFSLQTDPSIDSEQATTTALEAVAKWYQLSTTDLVATEPELWIFDESLLQPSNRPVELVWRLEVSPVDNSMPVRELILINAHSGSISFHFNQIDTNWHTSRIDKNDYPLVSPTCTTVVGSGSGDIYFKPYIQYDCDLSSSGVGAGDFNNDGKIDVALSVDEGPGFQHTLLVFLQDNSGNLAQPVSYETGKRTEYLAIGDMNNDGRDDIVTLDVFDATISVYLQNNTGTLNNRIIYGTNTSPDSIAIGDINNDGLDDIAVSHWSSANVGIFIQNGGSGTLNSMVTYSSVTAGYGDIAIGDINNDGLNDVVKMNGQGNSNNTLVVHTQNNSNTLNTYTLYTCISPCTGNGIEVNDVTGDNKADIVMSYGGNGSSAKIAVFTQNGSGNLGPSTSYSSYDIPEPVEIADMNSDNLLDVIVLHTGWLRAGIYTQKVDGTLDTEKLYPIPYKSYHSRDISIGDVNNDGLDDILIADGQGLVILYRQSPGSDTIAIESGSNQSAQLETQFSQPLKVKVVNYLLQPLSGINITFTAPSSGASGIFSNTNTSTTTAITDSNGIATSATFTSNNVNGNYVVVATGVGLTGSANFQLANSNQSIQTYTANNTTSLPGTFLCNESDLTCTEGVNLHADKAHLFAFGIYNFYLDKHNRQSIDNNMLPIISTVHYGNGYDNAFWNGTQMVYGDANGYALADDVVAHEYTHGVTQYESNLFYYYQSGAINESFSDVWGEWYDQTNGQGNDTAGVKWQIGEDVSGLGTLRSMSNPPTYNDPDKMTSPFYVESGADSGGVHSNSGVNNKAVYLMVDGGTFNNKTVTSLGWDKTGKIYYEVQTNLLSSGADYSDLYYALQQACTNLVGQHGITTSDCAEVKDAADAVEMNLQPIVDFNTDAPLCALDTPVPVTTEDFESGLSEWSFTNSSGYTRWQLDSPLGPFAQSGQHSLYASDYPSSVTDASARWVSFNVPAKTYLHFAHAYEFEYYEGSSNYYDGGVLEYSINGGATWIDAGSLMNYNGYDSTILVYAGSNPLEGRAAFVGSSHGYISTRLNLASLAGQNVIFRWRMGLDESVAGLGWWVDNIQVYICGSDPTFTDVPTWHPYFEDIEILYANGFTAGCSTSPLMFCPETTMNRAQAAVFMLRGNFGAGYLPPAPPWNTFSDDFSPGSWAQSWVQGMWNAGLTGGCSTSPMLYCPWEDMPRMQVAVFALRLMHGSSYVPPAGTGTVFADITDPTLWYAGWAEQAYADGLLPACGFSAGKPLFCPNELVSRGLGAFAIVRAKNLTMP